MNPLDAPLRGEKPWQRGYPLALLKEHAAVYQPLRKHCYGAFGQIKEREIADAMFQKKLIWKMEDSKVVGSAIFNVVRATTHDDFTGRPIKLDKETVLIKAFAGPAAINCIEVIVERAKGLPVWAEAYLEDKDQMGVMNDLGFNYQGTKVMASSDLKGMFRLGGEPYVGDHAEEATLKLIHPEYITDGERLAILNDLFSYQKHDTWANHYSNYNKRQSWKAFALKGYSTFEPEFIIKPSEMSAGWKEENPERLKAKSVNTTAWPHFPAVHKLLERMGFAYERVRFMKLLPKEGELTRHADITDRDAGVRDGKIARLHIPLVTNPQVHFQAWDSHGLVGVLNPPKERCLFYLDQRKPHTVRNEGASERIHLVLDVISNQRLRDALTGNAGL